MVSKDEDKYVIWPHYFDKSISRMKGRKISKKKAVENPSLDAIAKAAKSLGLNPIIEKECSHPSQSRKKEGRILIDTKDTKSKLLIQIANRI
jgi:signal recognition particle subunit SRP19